MYWLVRKIAENVGNNAVGPGELLPGVPEAHIVNAAYMHPEPFSGRVYGAKHGAWYASFELETSLSAVVFHEWRFLEDGRIQARYGFDYIAFLEAEELEICFQPEPVPRCYSTSPVQANNLLLEGSNGIVYANVRGHSGVVSAR